MGTIPEERNTPEGSAPPGDALSQAWQRIWAALLAERYQFASEYVTDKTVLDVPSGVGWGTSLLTGAASRLGVDLDLASCRYGLRRWGVAAACASMTALPLTSQAFDVVCCFEGLEHLTRHQGLQFVHETSRVLQPDGIFIGSVPVLLSGASHTGNPYHLYEYPVDDLERLLRRCFATAELFLVVGGSGVIAYFVAQGRHVSSQGAWVQIEKDVLLAVPESVDHAQQIIARYGQAYQLVLIISHPELLKNDLYVAVDQAGVDVVNCLSVADPWLSELTARLQHSTARMIWTIDTGGELISLRESGFPTLDPPAKQRGDEPAGGLDLAGARTLFGFLEGYHKPEFRSSALHKELRRRHLERVCVAALHFGDATLARMAASRLLRYDLTNRWYAKMLLRSLGTVRSVATVEVLS